MPPYLNTRSRVRKGMLPFVYNREITKDKKYYKIIGNRFCSPAKIIKRYLKRIFECVYGELTRKNFKELSDLKEIDIFFVNSDFKCIFNPVVYTEVLDLYLVYLSLYKKYGFTKDYLDRVILKDTNRKTNSKPKFNYFVTSGVKWKKRIKLSPEDRNIVLLREIPFFIEDFFREEIENPVSQEVVYMFSFFYLYCLVDYEFMLSTNETISGQKSLFEDKNCLIFKYIFDYIIEKNNKDCLKKYVVNEEIMPFLKTKICFKRPFNYNNVYLDFVDQNMVKEVFKNYNIENFNYKKIMEYGLVRFVKETFEEKFGEIKLEMINKVLIDFLVFIDLEKIIDLTYAKYRSFKILSFLTFLRSFDKFVDFGEYRFSCLRDRDNQLKERRLQDIKFSRLYLDFCEK